jgi:gas vesicle protein
VADNLTVTIGADSSKLRAELALVSQATKATQKELNTLAATFNKTGADADRMRLDAKARQLDQYKRSAADLNRQIAALSPTFNRVGASAEHAASGLQEFVHQGRGLGRVVSEFSNLSRGLESFTGIFGRLTGGFAGGLAGVAIARGFSAVAEQINKIRDNLIELRDTAAEIGVKPIALQAAREVAESVGQDANAATNVLKAVSAQIDEVRKKSTEQVSDAGVSVLRGGGAQGAGARTIQVQGAVSQTVTILRGGTQAAKDFNKALEALGIDISTIPVAKLDPVKITLLALQRFMEVSKTWDPTALNLVAKGLGSTADALKESAPAQIANLQKQIADLQKSSRGATAEQIAANNALIASQAALKTSYDEASNALVNTLRPAQVAVNTLLQEFFDRATTRIPVMDAAWTELAHSMAAGWRQAMSDIVSQSEAMWTAFSSGTQAASDGFKSIWQGTIEWLSNALSTVVDAAKSAAASISKVTSSGGGDISLGFASGGMVRGAGGGTSDSILARLSNGEFVMRAAAVQHWGSDLMASLNGLRNPGFALGGLVSPPRFAEGGPVAAGGTPVHLHLGGNSFALSGHDNVVNALVVEAHRQQMRSAGTKPSWFAARPSGR